MPFSEFRFLNGSDTVRDARFDVRDANTGAVSPVVIPNAQPETKVHALSPAAPPIPPSVDHIVTASVTTPGPTLNLAAPIDAPTGEYFLRISVVVSENTTTGQPIAAVLVGETNTGKVLSGTLT